METAAGVLILLVLLLGGGPLAALVLLALTLGMRTIAVPQ
jgi:hypothetical protein